MEERRKEMVANICVVSTLREKICLVKALIEML